MGEGGGVEDEVAVGGQDRGADGFRVRKVAVGPGQGHDLSATLRSGLDRRRDLAGSAELQDFHFSAGTLSPSAWLTNARKFPPLNR